MGSDSSRRNAPERRSGTELGSVRVPPFERWRIRLRLSRPLSLHFFHGPVLQGMLRRALGQHELPWGFIPVVCELGRVRFAVGDSYDIGLTLVGESRGLIGGVTAGLRRLGEERSPEGEALPKLGGNFEVESVEEIRAPDLAAELARIEGRDRLTLQFVSPLRLRRPKELDERGATYLNADCFPPGYFVAKLASRLRRLERGEAQAAPEERGGDGEGSGDGPSAVVDAGDLLWLDVPVEGTAGREPYAKGGVLGRVRLLGVPPEWLPVLVAGQYLHAGSATRYAMGRFLLTDVNSPREDVFRPSAAALDRAARRAVLERSFEHLLADSEAAGADGVKPEEFDDQREAQLLELAGQLREGTYRPSPLLGFLSHERDKIRPLAIPTVRDRVAQRAAAEVLGEAIEVLLEDCSYAYRRSYSRAGAAREIELAYREGFRYVLDADIRSFFDSVNWDRLFGKLEALFPHEPLVDVVAEWVKAPILFQGQTIKRRQGLPQGTAISPLLANLFLDEFDKEVLGADYRLVRYADDFVILCRDAERAREAREDVRRALRDLGLELHEEKTAVRSLDDGFTYLGYLFCRSMVLDAEESRALVDPTAALDPARVPSRSWLAQVPFERLRQLMARASGEGRAKGIELVPLLERESHARLDKRPLYVVTPGASLRLRNDNVAVEVPGEAVRHYPIRSISPRVVAGRANATLPVLLRLGQLEVPSYFCRSSGELYAVLGPHRAEWQLWMDQADYAADRRASVDFSREVVIAKLGNTATTLVRYELDGKSGVADEIRQLRREAVNKSTLEALRGLEGRGATLYFQAVSERLDAAWGFSGRTRNPPLDPVNAMLSFGYTILYNCLSTALYAAGLNPRIGLFHEARGAHDALASDLVEEFRCLADGVVWGLVNRRRVGPEDFRTGKDGVQGCWMTRDFRRTFLDALSGRLMVEFTPEESEGGCTYLEFMARQAWQVRRLVSRQIPRYRPFLFHG